MLIDGLIHDVPDQFRNGYASLMTQRVSIIERAFQIARTGEYSGTKGVIDRLKREGYEPGRSPAISGIALCPDQEGMCRGTGRRLIRSGRQGAGSSFQWR
jgi:hypothetical protein